MEDLFRKTEANAVGGDFEATAVEMSVVGAGAEDDDQAIQIRPLETESDEIQADSTGGKCGLGRWRPKWLQFFNTPKWFLFFHCLFVLCQSITVSGECMHLQYLRISF